jgi:hypothetical protein
MRLNHTFFLATNEKLGLLVTRRDIYQPPFMDLGSLNFTKCKEKQFSSSSIDYRGAVIQRDYGLA